MLVETLIDCLFEWLIINNEYYLFICWLLYFNSFDLQSLSHNIRRENDQRRKSSSHCAAKQRTQHIQLATLIIDEVPTAKETESRPILNIEQLLFDWTVTSETYR
jgi:hypothetical protein